MTGMLTPVTPTAASAPAVGEATAEVAGARTTAEAERNAPIERRRDRVEDQIVEIISDSGEGAQRCGQSLAAIAARTGYGVGTGEIMPAEPSTSRSGRCI